MLSKNSSVSRWNAWRRLSSKSGNSSEFGTDAAQVAQLQPLAGEVVDQRREPRGRPASGAPAARAPPACCSLPRPASVEQLVVGDAAPQEERQPRRQLEVAEAIHACRARRVAGSRSTRNTNIGLARMRCSARLDARLEAAVAPARVVERQQRPHVLVGHRPAIGAPRQRRQDLPGARGPRRPRARWPAREDPAAARRVARAGGVEGPVDA